MEVSMSKIVTMYNNKGGVAKTTTLFSLGVYLAQNGSRVLLADCDPQCNLTELFFASYPDVDSTDVELPGTSIYQALLPRFKGETGVINPDTVTLVESMLYSQLFLFKGDLEFSSAETYFGNSWNQAITENINEKNTYVVLHKLLQALAQGQGFDYILCDVGPSTGAITRTVVLACDGIFIPLAPDRFCNQAVRLLGRIMKEWIKRHQQISETLRPFGIESFPGKPVLFGAVNQNFKILSASRAKQSYVRWQELISADIQKYLLSEQGIEASEGLDRTNPYIANIRDVGPLAPVAQMFGRAMFDVQQEHTREASTTGGMYYGIVWETWKERMAEYEAEIAKIAEAII
jgi:cellulose biosynthesis protein BcsQ